MTTDWFYLVLFSYFFRYCSTKIWRVLFGLATHWVQIFKKGVLTRRAGRADKPEQTGGRGTGWKSGREAREATRRAWVLGTTRSRPVRAGTYKPLNGWAGIAPGACAWATPPDGGPCGRARFASQAPPLCQIQRLKLPKLPRQLCLKQRRNGEGATCARFLSATGARRKAYLLKGLLSVLVVKSAKTHAFLINLYKIGIFIGKILVIFEERFLINLQSIKHTAIAKHES